MNLVMKMLCSLFFVLYLMCVGDCQTTIDNLTLIDSISENNSSELNVTNDVNEVINLNPSISPISSHSVPPPSASSVANFLHRNGQKKNFGYEFLSKLRPAEIFRPIAEKFSDMVNSFYPNQPYINNDYFGYGSNNNVGPYPLTLPALLLEKLNVKKQQFYSNAHGAIFGTGYYGHEDYPFAVRTVKGKEE